MQEADLIKILDFCRDAARAHEGKLSAAMHELQIKSGEAERLVEEVKQLEVQLHAKEDALARVPSAVQQQVYCVLSQMNFAGSSSEVLE